MVDYTARASLTLDCGHSAKIHFVGDEPQPDLVCDTCGATDKLTPEQIATIKKRIYDAAKADLTAKIGEQFRDIFKG